MVASRALRLIALLLAVGIASASHAATPALVVDVDSGKVLYAERATDPWFPASVTKLMTAYVAFEAVRSGKLSMDSLLTVSANAAAMPPSKMGFSPGTEITLDNALKMIMVKSANDVAVAIAEGIGGSVEGFAAMMNEASRRLGMNESRWTNPHGLPDPAQYTSARDMAILGRALLRDFPEYRHLFQLSAIQLGRRVMANHNGLIGRYPGADGMKTGFICSSGFNVVASATQNGRRLIAVVFGSPSAKERTLKAADLFDRGFASFGWGSQTLETLPASAQTAPPDMRPVICGRQGPAPAEEDGQTAMVEAHANGASSQADNPTGLFAAPAFGALAFSGGSVPGPKRTLGPRAPLQPVLVWTGRSPTTALAEDAGAGKPAARARKGTRTAAKPAPAKAKPAVAAAAGRAGEKPKTAAASLKPEPKQAAKAGDKAAAKPAAKAAAAAPRAAAKPAPKPAAKPKAAE